MRHPADATDGITDAMMASRVTAFSIKLLIFFFFLFFSNCSLSPRGGFLYQCTLFVVVSAQGQGGAGRGFSRSPSIDPASGYFVPARSWLLATAYLPRACVTIGCGIKKISK
jgi:hypothetical protein